MAIKISGSTIIDDSRNIVSGAAATFTGNVTIGGTLTYEDVTNIDSIGIITARQNIHIGESIVHLGDTDTKINFPANNNITFDTAGTQRMIIGGLGNISISNDFRIPDKLAHLGDLDTQMRFPEDDTVSFETAGSERLRIASDGVITGRGELRLTQGTSVVSNGDEIGSLMYLYPSNDNKNAKIVAIQNGGTSGADLAFYTRQQGDATNTDGGTEKLRITDSGRVGIMETSPQSPLQVKGGIRSAQTPGNGHIDLKHDGTNGSVTTSSGHFLFYNSNNSGSYIFHTTSSNSAKIEIKSDGKIAFNSGGTVNATYQFDYAPATGGIIVNANASFTGNATAIQFRTAPSTVSGSITLTNNGSTTAYVTSSDYRLKENAVAISDGITRLKTLKPRRFNFKTFTDRTVDGFIAHEVTAVAEATTGAKDEVDSNGKPIYQGIDVSKLVPLITAALQEAIAKIETLETKVAALEAS